MIVIQNGGFVRGNNPTSNDPTLFPVGTGSEYTPATVSATFTSGAAPYYEVSVAAAAAPNVVSSGSSLTKYWTVNSNDLTISSGSIAMTYHNTEINGTDTQYVPAYYSGSAWTSGLVSDVTEASNLATFTISAVAELNGNYTAGEFNAFNLLLNTVSPVGNALDVVANSNITLTFSENMSQNSVDGGTGSVLDDNIQVRSATNGNIAGIWSGDGTTTLTFNPTNDFDAGEVIHITVTQAVQSSASASLSKPAAASFITQTSSGSSTPNHFDERIVSAIADGALSVKVGDVDGDGDLDILSASFNDNKKRPQLNFS